jgi:hypothetical protein
MLSNDEGVNEALGEEDIEEEDNYGCEDYNEVEENYQPEEDAELAKREKEEKEKKAQTSLATWG